MLGFCGVLERGFSGWKWDLADMAKGDESKFIEDVLNKLDCKCFHVSKHMIGVDSGLLLEIATTDVHVVGIYGMEGVGKTPTAESVFNRLC